MEYRDRDLEKMLDQIWTFQGVNRSPLSSKKFREFLAVLNGIMVNTDWLDQREISIGSSIWIDAELLEYISELPNMDDFKCRVSKAAEDSSFLSVLTVTLNESAYK